MWSQNAEQTVCVMTAAGSDGSISERTSFSFLNLCHKLNGTRHCYEVGVGSYSGHVWRINGPYPCKTYAYLVVFWYELELRPLEVKQVLVDQRYLVK